MPWLSLVTGLIKLAGAIADYMRERQLLDAGAKAQIADSLLAFNKRLDIGLRIQNEHRTTDAAVDELRRGGGM